MVIMIKDILIKLYEEKDAPFLAAIFFNTIHNINSKDYSSEQINAWAPPIEIERWIKKWRKVPPFVAVLNDTIVGFAEFEENGHIDCFYCHHEYQRCGVGTVLMNTIEDEAKKNNIKTIYAEVSITAKPFFAEKGFKIVKEQSVNVRGINLTNFVMEKILG